MKPCLNQDTLRSTPTDKFLRIAKKTGFDAVEFTMDKIETANDQTVLNKLIEELREQKLHTASINGPENFNLLEHHDFSTLLKRTDVIVSAARDMECNLLIPVPSPIKPGTSKEETIEQTTRALIELADHCGDINLGFEFLGMRDCSINNLEAASEVVGRVGLPNVGLVIDTFHMYLSDSKLSDIGELKDRVFLVHVNDSERGDKANLTDANRLFPGEGTIDLKAFAATIGRIGYDGFLSLELLRPEYWQRDAEEIARAGRDSLKRVFGV